MAGQYSQYSTPPTGAVYSTQTSPKPSLPRSISTTNLKTTKRCRAVIQQDWCSTAPVGGTNFFTSMPCYTLTLPDLKDYPPEFQQFVFDQIIDKETQGALESWKCLNWCPSATKLVPLYTLGDGNCLLHAASLGMWGFQDRDYFLRRAVSHACSNTCTAGTLNTFYRRWQCKREMENANCRVQLDQDQWQKEWRLIVNQASADVPAAGSLDSLEEFHIFVLANVLRRPVIMYAVPKMRSVYGATLPGVSFHGVYLPLLWDPNSCRKDPLPLSFYGGHFASLVVVDSPQQCRNGYLVLPLTDFYGQQLPIRFILPEEDPTVLLMDYLNLMEIQNHGSPHFQQNAVCAKLTIVEIPAFLKPLISEFIDACSDAYLTQCQVLTQQQQQPSLLSEGSRTLAQQGVGDGAPRTPCINNCGMSGDPETAGLCSQCYRKAQAEAQAQERDRPGSRKSYTYSTRAGQRLGSQQPSGQSYQKPPAQTSTLSGIQGSIKCPHCANPGHPMYLGMCESCYRRTTHGQQQQFRPPQHTYESPNPQAQLKPPAVPPPRPKNVLGGTSKGNKHLYEKAIMSVEEVSRRHDDIRKLCEQALTKVDAVERRLGEAEARADAAERRAEQATTRVETAERHATDLEETLTRRIANLELSFQDIQFDPHSLPFWAIQREEIQVTNEEIGRGGWGAIKVALFRGQRVAAKALHNQIISPHNLRLFAREMNMAARVRHPNLLQFIGATTEGEPIILTELMHTSLRNVLISSTLSWSQIKSIFLDIVRALNYLHLMQPRPIIHRDLSSANVLLEPSSKTTWKAKLSDFGSTNFASNMATTGPGNPLYAPPEAYNPYQQTPKMDIFSFGILLIETCTRQLKS